MDADGDHRRAGRQHRRRRLWEDSQISAPEIFAVGDVMIEFVERPLSDFSREACDARCQAAILDECNCPCYGKNHGLAYRKVG